MFARISVSAKFLRRDDDARKYEVAKVAKCVVVWQVLCEVVFSVAVRVGFAGFGRLRSMSVVEIMVRSPRRKCVRDAWPPRATCDAEPKPAAPSYPVAGVQTRSVEQRGAEYPRQETAMRFARPLP
jgi:hypothetical protein